MPSLPRRAGFRRGLLIALAGMVCALVGGAAEVPRAFPLWDGKETVESYAARVHLPPTRSFDLGGGVTLDLVLIPAGQFMMGSPEPPPPVISWRWAGVMGTCGLILVVALLCVPLVNWIKTRKFSFSLRWLLLFTASCGLCVGGVVRFHLGKEQAERYTAALALYEKLPADEKPAHLETIAEPFYMGKYTVTQAQYGIVMGNNPSGFKGAQLPVERIAQKMAEAFQAVLNFNCKGVLSAKEQFQLPMESQWEYACRAGTTTAFNTGDSLSTDDANFDGRGTTRINGARGIYRGKTMPVGSFRPNKFGLYDMHGNVVQWCEAPTNPLAVDSIPLRGGCYASDENGCRSASKFNMDNQSRPDFFGFRVILTVPPPAQR